MELIDLVEVLKDCPIGMELDSPVLIGKKKFKGFKKWDKDYPIEVQVDSDVYFLTRYGQLYDTPTCGCVIYPKGEDTWKNYLANSFKDGDIVVTDLGNIAIVADEIGVNSYKTYCVLYRSENKLYTTGDTVNPKRLATYDERGLLFQALVEYGYKWNPETKSVESLNLVKKMVDLYYAFNKEKAVEICKEHGMTVKEAVINNLDIIIEGLTGIKEIISNGKATENEDWMEVALPLRNMMNVLLNQWYKENEHGE